MRNELSPVKVIKGFELEVQNLQNGTPDELKAIVEKQVEQIVKIVEDSIIKIERAKELSASASAIKPGFFNNFFGSETRKKTDLLAQGLTATNDAVAEQNELIQAVTRLAMGGTVYARLLIDELKKVDDALDKSISKNGAIGFKHGEVLGNIIIEIENNLAEKQAYEKQRAEQEEKLNRQKSRLDKLETQLIDKEGDYENRQKAQETRLDALETQAATRKQNYEIRQVAQENRLDALENLTKQIKINSAVAYTALVLGAVSIGIQFIM